METAKRYVEFVYSGAYDPAKFERSTKFGWAMTELYKDTGDRRLLDIIEGELGARIVIEDHCAGVRPFYHKISEVGDPYQALANGYLDQAPCARMKPLDDGVAFSGKLAQEYGVDGVIYVFLKFCACYGVSKKEFITEFQKQGLSILELSSDYSESDYGQLKTRIEAFIEVLNERGDVKSHEQHVNA